MKDEKGQVLSLLGKQPGEASQFHGPIFQMRRLRHRDSICQSHWVCGVSWALYGAPTLCCSKACASPNGKQEKISCFNYPIEL